MNADLQIDNIRVGAMVKLMGGGVHLRTHTSTINNCAICFVYYCSEWSSQTKRLVYVDIYTSSLYNYLAVIVLPHHHVCCHFCAVFNDVLNTKRSVSGGTIPLSSDQNKTKPKQNNIDK